MNHERCRLNPNQLVAHYADKLGRLAINTALTIRHEVSPPKPVAPVIERPRFVDSELVIIDDEHAVIRSRDEK